MNIDFEHFAKQDPNLFGELMRQWCFPGDGTGAYSNFELLDGFEILPSESGIAKKMLEAMQYHEPIDPTPDMYFHPEYHVYVAWYWDGDGTLLIGYNGKWVLNTDCKKSYDWNFVNVASRVQKLAVSHLIDNHTSQAIINAIGALADFRYDDGIELLDKARVSIEETITLAKEEQGRMNQEAL